MDKVLASLVGVSGTIVSFLIGDWSAGLLILASLMTFDFVTGLMKAAYFKTLSSKVGFKGVMKKFAILIVVMVANLADTFIGNQDPIFKTMAIYFYVAIEGISLVENLKLIGLPIPSFITQFFAQLKEKGDSNPSNKNK